MLQRKPIAVTLLRSIPVIVSVVALASVLVAARVSAASIEVVEAEPDVVNSAARYSTQSARQSASVSETEGSRPAPRVPKNTSTNMSAELYVQFQRLQAEVQVLRGLVEQQSYLIDQLSQKRLEDYIDLDRRIGELQNKTSTAGSRTSSASSNSAPSRQSSAVIPVPTSSTVTRAAAAATQVTPATPPKQIPKATADAPQAKAVYRAAYQRLKQNELDTAKIEFIAFIEAYPESRDVPGAYFWLGELYYVESDLEQSRRAFSSLVDEFPEHRKVPDAKFKLGKIYHQLGQTEKARVLLESVLADYPNSKAANPASEYLKNSLR